MNTYTGGNVRNLRYIARAWIGNEITKSIIHLALAKTQSKRMVIFKPSEEAFLATLGTPNGAGCVHLLMQHKQILGFKTIARVVVGYDGPTFQSPFLVFEVADMPFSALTAVGGEGVCNLSETSGMAEN